MFFNSILLMFIFYNQDKFFSVTILTKASMEMAKFFAYFLAQLIIFMEWGDFMTLNYISLGSLLFTFFLAIFLPFVRWQEVNQRIFAEESESKKNFFRYFFSFRQFVTESL